MADRLTQLQDAVDELAQQFVASLHYVHVHHDLLPLSPTDTVRKEVKNDTAEVDPHPINTFKANQRELAQDLIIKEQQIEYLISVLPGIGNSEEMQEKRIKELEEQLKEAEEKRRAALAEKEIVLKKLDEVIRSVKRP